MLTIKASTHATPAAQAYVQGKPIAQAVARVCSIGRTDWSIAQGMDVCGEPAVGKSQYCKEHRAESRARFKATIAAQAEERDAKRAAYVQAIDRAVKARNGGSQGSVVLRPASTSFARWCVANVAEYEAAPGCVVLPGFDDCQAAATSLTASVDNTRFDARPDATKATRKARK